MTDEATAASPQQSRGGGPSRRAFLVGGTAAVLVGAGGGVGAELLRPHHRTPPPKPPAALVAALAAERALIGSLDVSLAASPGSHAALAQVRADHVAHERALAAVLTDVAGPGAASPSASGTSSPRPPVLDQAALRAAETAASRAAISRAKALTGRDAALLASIAACEASHAELLA